MYLRFWPLLQGNLISYIPFLSLPLYAHSGRADAENIDNVQINNGGQQLECRELQSVTMNGCSNYKNDSKLIREKITNYFNIIGRV